MVGEQVHGSPLVGRPLLTKAVCVLEGVATESVRKDMALGIEGRETALL